MKVFSFFTGGKDSTAAYLRAIEDGYTPNLLVTIVPDRLDSYMFHAINLGYTGYHAMLLEKDIIYYRVSGLKERELDELHPLISRLYESGYKMATVGGILSNYQRRRFEKLLDIYGIELYSPFWGYPSDELLYRYFDMGIKYMIVSVSSGGLDKECLGWVIDGYDDIDRLIELGKIHGFNPTGEGGEYESFVLYTPRFWGYLKPKRYKIHWDGVSGYLELEEVDIDSIGRGIERRMDVNI